MAHELDFSLGRGAIAIRHDGNTPWHGYGERVPEEELADLDAWQVRGGIAYDVERRAVYYSKRIQDPDNPEQLKNIPTPIENRRALVRSDTQDVLSVVSDGYHVVQPKEIVEFYRSLIEDQGFQIDTVGALSGGKRIWALAKAGPDITIMGQDRLANYLLLATSYDASMATIARPTSVRVVCNNTLSYALSSGSSYIAIPHSSKIDWDYLKGELGLLGESQEKFESELNKLAMTSVDLDTAIAFFRQVLGNEAVKIDDKGALEYTNNFKKMFSLYEIGMGQEMRSANHTAWGLVNAVTEYQDHVVKARDNGTRLNSSWFGQGATRKRRAFDLAKDLAGITSEAA